MADAESKKMMGNLWASSPSADRTNPENEDLDRVNGWPVSYEQQGAGKNPEREVFNQLMRELTGAFSERIRTGGTPPWDSEINYYQYARTIGSDGNKYWAVIANGPSHGNSSDPVTDSGTVWKIY